MRLELQASRAFSERTPEQRAAEEFELDLTNPGDRAFASSYVAKRRAIAWDMIRDTPGEAIHALAFFAGAVDEHGQLLGDPGQMSRNIAATADALASLPANVLASINNRADLRGAAIANRDAEALAYIDAGGDVTLLKLGASGVAGLATKSALGVMQRVPGGLSSEATLDSTQRLMPKPMFNDIDSEFSAINQLPKNNTGKVQVLDTGTFAELDRVRVVGDKITPDHQPSAASLLAAREAEIMAAEGRHLTRAEAKAVYDAGASMAIPENVHREFSRTYGGRNTADQIALDSKNGRRAAALDQVRLRQALVDKGFDADAVDAAFKLRDRLNEKLSNW